jgi:hypothetical protein
MSKLQPNVETINKVLSKAMDSETFNERWQLMHNCKFIIDEKLNPRVEFKYNADTKRYLHDLGIYFNQIVSDCNSSGDVSSEEDAVKCYEEMRKFLTYYKESLQGNPITLRTDQLNLLGERSGRGHKITNNPWLTKNPWSNGGGKKSKKKLHRKQKKQKSRRNKR